MNQEQTSSNESRTDLEQWTKNRPRAMNQEQTSSKMLKEN